MPLPPLIITVIPDEHPFFRYLVLASRRLSETMIEALCAGQGVSLETDEYSMLFLDYGKRSAVTNELELQEGIDQVVAPGNSMFVLDVADESVWDQIKDTLIERLRVVLGAPSVELYEPPMPDLTRIHKG